jgi:hypothetical protein
MTINCKLDICNFDISEDERRILMQFVQLSIYLQNILMGGSLDSALEFKIADGNFAITSEDLLATINTIKLLTSDNFGELVPAPPKQAQ